MLEIYLAFLLHGKPVDLPPQIILSKEERAWSEISKLPIEQRTRMLKLIECESGGNWDVKVLDSNNKYSFGGLQFQQATFEMAGKGILPEGLDKDESLNFIYEPEYQIPIASKMMKDKKWKNHWKICSSKIK